MECKYGENVPPFVQGCDLQQCSVDLTAILGEVAILPSKEKLDGFEDGGLKEPLSNTKVK